MPKIAVANTHQTVITTFETTPGTCQDLMDMLTAAYDEFISKQPGFIAAGLHEAGQFLAGFFLDPQKHQEGPELQLFHFAAQDHAEGPVRFCLGQGAGAGFTLAEYAHIFSKGVFFGPGIVASVVGHLGFAFGLKAVIRFGQPGNLAADLGR